MMGISAPPPCPSYLRPRCLVHCREAPVARALGEGALVTIAEQLGAIVKERMEVREGFLAQLTSAKSQAKEVQYTSRGRRRYEP